MGEIAEEMFDQALEEEADHIVGTCDPQTCRYCWDEMTPEQQRNAMEALDQSAPF